MLHLHGTKKGFCLEQQISRRGCYATIVHVCNEICGVSKDLLMCIESIALHYNEDGDLYEFVRSIEFGMPIKKRFSIAKHKKIQPSICPKVSASVIRNR